MYIGITFISPQNKLYKYTAYFRANLLKKHAYFICSKNNKDKPHLIYANNQKLLGLPVTANLMMQVFLHLCTK
jgi:hypothetical protein